jgi:hypothetical protein
MEAQNLLLLTRPITSSPPVKLKSLFRRPAAINKAGFSIKEPARRRVSASWSVWWAAGWVHGDGQLKRLMQKKPRPARTASLFGQPRAWWQQSWNGGFRNLRLISTVAGRCIYNKISFSFLLVIHSELSYRDPVCCSWKILCEISSAGDYASHLMMHNID